MAKILLVDDDEAFRTALQKTLESLGHQIVPANNGLVALLKLEDGKFDLVISDIRMPELDGVELTKHIKGHYQTPVILMTGFAEILETQEASKLGADDFIAKPFERKALAHAIDRALGLKKSEDISENEDFCKLSIEDFNSGREIPYGIFLKISDRKFVKIAHKGESINVGRVVHYRSRGLNFLYLKKQDFRDYVGFHLDEASAARKKTPEEAAKQKRLLETASKILAANILTLPIPNDVCKTSAAFVETTLEILLDDTDLIGILDLLNQHVDHLYHHAVSVSFYSVAIAKTVSWKLPTNNFKVAAAGLLNNVGHKEIDPTFLKKPKVQWTMDDVKIYESHGFRGINILRQVRSLHDDIIQIVREQHDKDSPISHPISKLVLVANEFVELVMKTPHSPGMQPDEAAKIIEEQKDPRHDKSFVKALRNLFPPIQA